MPYSLTDFCSDLSATLKAKGQSGLPDIAGKLSELLEESGLRRGDVFRGYPGRQARALAPSANGRVCPGSRPGRRQDRQAAQPRRVMGDLRHRTRRDRNDGVAAGQSGKRRRRRLGEGEAIRARPGSNAGLRVRRHPLDRTPAKGLGHPHHRHRSRYNSPLSFPGQDRQNSRKRLITRPRLRSTAAMRRGWRERFCSVRLVRLRCDRFVGRDRCLIGQSVDEFGKTRAELLA